MGRWRLAGVLITYGNSAAFWNFGVRAGMAFRHIFSDLAVCTLDFGAASKDQQTGHCGPGDHDGMPALLDGYGCLLRLGPAVFRQPGGSAVFARRGNSAGSIVRDRLLHDSHPAVFSAESLFRFR